MDPEETTRWADEGEYDYFVIDVPFKDIMGIYNTIPLIVIKTSEGYTSVCKIDDSSTRKILSGTLKDLNFKDFNCLPAVLVYVIAKEYQQALLEIDRDRRALERTLSHRTGNKEIIKIHDLENSLVYFFTSLSSCSAIITKLKHDYEESTDQYYKKYIKAAAIEFKQAIEMSKIYREVMDSTGEMVSALVNNQLGDLMKKLTCVSLITSVPMILSGIYGMNVELPFMNESFAFTMVISGILFGSIGLALMLKKIKLL